MCRPNPHLAPRSERYRHATSLHPFVGACWGFPPSVCSRMSLYGAASLRCAVATPPMNSTTSVHQQVHRGVLAYGSCGVGEVREGREVRDMAPYAVRHGAPLSTAWPKIMPIANARHVAPAPYRY